MWHLDWDWNVHIKFRSTGTQTLVCQTVKHQPQKTATHDLSLGKCGGMGPYISKDVDTVIKETEMKTEKHVWNKT
jgi:hypothetical protein